MCLEWWSFEIAQIVSGLMGEVALATQLITMQFAAFAFMMPLGISVGKFFFVTRKTGMHVEWRVQPGWQPGPCLCHSPPFRLCLRVQSLPRRSRHCACRKLVRSKQALGSSACGAGLPCMCSRHMYVGCLHRLFVLLTVVPPLLMIFPAPFFCHTFPRHFAQLP